MAYDAPFGRYATIEKRPVAFDRVRNASWPKGDYGVGSVATVVAVSPFGLFPRVPIGTCVLTLLQERIAALFEGDPGVHAVSGDDKRVIGKGGQLLQGIH